jgi:galactokinase
MIDVERLRDAFVAEHATAPRIFWAPGRVNLIGEHTDYNEGFVLPMATSLGTAVAAAPRTDRRVRARSLHFGETREFDLNAPPPPASLEWIAYIEGVARALERRGAILCGADLVVASDVPIGAGLSSSAALEVSAGLALASLSGAAIEPLALALAGQEAEERAAGVPSGIMDQYAAVFARGGQALLLDCRALAATLVPIDVRCMAIVVCDSGVERRLASSAYDDRREECRRAVALLHDALPGIRALRDLDAETLERVAAHLPDPIRRRCRHVVTENARTLRAAEALRRGDAEEMGRLMLASHASLRDDFEVSVRQLDRLVEIACSMSGVFGARLTGAGFGGCTVNLVARGALAEFANAVPRLYAEAIPDATVTLFVIEPGGGAHELDV